MQVERSDRAVQRSADDDEAAGGEGDVADAAGVLGEGDEAEAAVGVPHFDLWRKKNSMISDTDTFRQQQQICTGHHSLFLRVLKSWFGVNSVQCKVFNTHFSIVASCGDVLSVWRVSQRRHVVEVSLLLEDVGLALPLPHQQLAHP